MDGTFHLSLPLARITATEDRRPRTAHCANSEHTVRGLADHDSRKTGRLMQIMPAPTEDAPPPCPTCGQPASSTSVHEQLSGVAIGNYMCPGEHIWVTKWVAGGVA